MRTIDCSTTHIALIPSSSVEAFGWIDPSAFNKSNRIRSGLSLLQAYVARSISSSRRLKEGVRLEHIQAFTTSATWYGFASRINLVSHE